MEHQFVISLIGGKAKQEALCGGSAEFHAYIFIIAPVFGKLRIDILDGDFGTGFGALAVELDFEHLGLQQQRN